MKQLVGWFQTRNTSKKGQTSMAKENKLFSIYGARFSKSKERVNISIVAGDGDEKTWGTISIKLEDSKKVKVVVKDNTAYIKIPFLEDLPPKKTAKGKKKEVEDTEDLPF